jgi:hypothetical protein
VPKPLCRHIGRCRDIGVRHGGDAEPLHSGLQHRARDRVSDHTGGRHGTYIDLKTLAFGVLIKHRSAPRERQARVNVRGGGRGFRKSPVSSLIIIIGATHPPQSSGARKKSGPINATGVIIGGPINANGHKWWNVNYTSGPDGGVCRIGW